MVMQEYVNVKCFTFIQSTEPTSAQSHDTWLDTSTNKLKLFTNSNWENYSTAKYLSACNSSNYGFNCGCFNSNHLSTIYRITFPFDSRTATHIGNLSGTRSGSSATDGTDFTTLFI